MITALLLPFAQVAAQAPGATESKVVRQRDLVETFYGVPREMTLADVSKLPFRYRIGTALSEGMSLRTALVAAKGRVDIEVVFDRRGNSIELNTKSRYAQDPRGVTIGDTLSTVQRRWPCGRLYYGNSVEGGQRYARYMTGSNVLFEMSTASFEDLSKLTVQQIRVVNYRTLTNASKGKCGSRG